MKKKKKQKLTEKQFKDWTLTFSQSVFVTITILWIFGIVYSAALILVAILNVDQFSFIDTLVTELCSVFKVSVVGILLKSCVENIFKFNDIFPSSSNPETDIETDEIDDLNE